MTPSPRRKTTITINPDDYITEGQGTQNNQVDYKKLTEYIDPRLRAEALQHKDEEVRKCLMLEITAFMKTLRQKIGGLDGAYNPKNQIAIGLGEAFEDLKRGWEICLKLKGK